MPGRPSSGRPTKHRTAGSTTARPPISSPSRRRARLSSLAHSLPARPASLRRRPTSTRSPPSTRPATPQASTVHSFTTSAATWTETTTADFADGTFTGTAPAAIGNGAVESGPAAGGTLFSDDFGGAASGWTPLNGPGRRRLGEYLYTNDTSNYQASMITGLTSNHFSIESRQRITAGNPGLMGYVWGIQSATPANQGWKNGAYMVQWYNDSLKIFRWIGIRRRLPRWAASPPCRTPTVGSLVHAPAGRQREQLRGLRRRREPCSRPRTRRSEPAGSRLVGYETGATHYDDVVVSSLVEHLCRERHVHLQRVRRRQHGCWDRSVVDGHHAGRHRVWR